MPTLDYSKLPPADAEGATVNLPLLQKLYIIDRHIRDSFKLPPSYDAGLGAVSLMLERPLKNGGYWNSPNNTLSFARTGGSGDHYSLLIRNGVIDETSPVVMTWPTAAEEDVTTIVGESLYDFLCFGLHTGFFQIFGHPDDELPTDTSGLWFMPSVPEDKRRVLRFLAQELELFPWPVEDCEDRFQSLQERFLHLVDVPDE